MKNNKKLLIELKNNEIILEKEILIENQIFSDNIIYEFSIKGLIVPDPCEESKKFKLTKIIKIIYHQEYL